MLFARAALVAVLLLGGCRMSAENGHRDGSKSAAAAVAPILAAPDAVDTASFAKPLEARVTHVALDLTVNFETRRIEGAAMLDIDRRRDAKEIVLDDNGLEIATVGDASGRKLPFTVGARD